MRILLVLLALGCLPGAEALTWNDLLIKIRRSPDVGPVAIYLGAASNKIPQLVRSGGIDTQGIPFAVLPSTDEALNPATNRVVSGARIQDFYGATAGTVIFLDDEGIFMAELAMPQSLHRNRPEIFTLYFRYLASGNFKKMNIVEFARARGEDGMLLGAIRGMSERIAVQELKGDERLVVGRNAMAGTPIDPWDPTNQGVFFVYTTDPSGPVFMAQLAEIWRGFESLQPQITIVVPPGKEPDLTKLPSTFLAVLAYAPAQDIAAMGSSPVTVVTATQQGKRTGRRLVGFQPANVLAQVLGISGKAIRGFNRDLPFGETDDQAQLPSIIQPARAK